MAQLFSLGHETFSGFIYERDFSSFARRRSRSFVFTRRRHLYRSRFVLYSAAKVEQILAVDS